MRSALVVIASCVVLGCGSDDGSSSVPSAPVVSLVGEVHLHQFSHGGAHASALFVAEPRPRANASLDAIVDLDPPMVARDGDCALFVQPACDPACSGDAICLTEDSCVVIDPFVDVDAGPVDVTGSSRAARIHMWFVEDDAPYSADPPAFAGPLFSGGDRLVVHGGVGARAFSTTMIAPAPVVVTAPDLGRDLHVGDGDFALAWIPGGQGLGMVITLTTSSIDRPTSAFVRCVTDDDGALVVSRALVSGLVPPPRDLYLDVAREDLRIVPTLSPGVGVIVHASEETAKGGRDD